MKLTRTILLPLVVLLAAALAPSGVASATPTPHVSVSRATGLHDGSRVVTHARGLRPDHQYSVVLCDHGPFFGVEYCPDLAVVTTDDAGRAVARVHLPAYVRHFQMTALDYHPVFCRDDACRLFFVDYDTPDGSADPGTTASRTLEFVGHTASLSATPSQSLPTLKRVTASGAAPGAEGRTVLVAERVCLETFQYAECTGAMPYRATTVDATGHFSRTYRVRRYLPDGSGRRHDCREPDDSFYQCRLIAVVLDRSGQPDLTFGEAMKFGTPGVPLTFRP